jgi:ubiquinone/menaquinone biosynthesis C-methylase UbiE
MAELQFRETAAAGYDRAVGHMTRQLIPTLLRAARIAPGQRVLDIATGTGIAAEAAAEVVGSNGHVTATDISPAMIERARERLGGVPNISFAVEDGQRLTLPEESFDAVLCNMGLFYFPDPARGLVEFRRVLRPGGRAVVSNNTTPDRSLISRVLTIIGRHVPSKAAEAARLFSLGDEGHVRGLFEAARFREVETTTETLHITFPSFDAYFGGVEQGAGNVGQEYMSLSEDIRRVVREEARHDVGDDGGPIEIQVTVRFASGQR